MNKELESDMAAAKLLGHTPVRAWESGCPSDDPEAGYASVSNERFSLSDKATRYNVIQALGEKYGLTIQTKDKEWSVHLVVDDSYSTIFSCWQPTLEAALRLVCMEVDGE